MATTTYNIDRRDFEKWLGEQADRVFPTTNCSHCALAEFLEELFLEELTEEKVWCGFASFETKSLGHRILPSWAREFVRSATRMSDQFEHAPASALLAALREIPEDAE